MPPEIETIMAMNKAFIGCVVLLILLCGCTRDNDTIYYPVGNISIEKGEETWNTGNGKLHLIAKSYNNTDYTLDTLARYPDDPTVGKLTFMFNLKNQLTDNEVNGFNGTGRTELTMSLGYKDGNFPTESLLPIYVPSDDNAQYAVKLRLKGELEVVDEGWTIDYAYAQLASQFQVYPPENFPNEIFLCKGGTLLGIFDNARRICTFDISYERYNLSFSQLYFNLFVNLAGQKRDSRIRLKIDQESFLEICRQAEQDSNSTS